MSYGVRRFSSDDKLWAEIAVQIALLPVETVGVNLVQFVVEVQLEHFSFDQMAEIETIRHVHEHVVVAHVGAKSRVRIVLCRVDEGRLSFRIVNDIAADQVAEHDVLDIPAASAKINK